VEVPLARPLKQSEKTMVHPTAVATTTHVPTGKLSSKVAAGASGSKGVANAKKTVMPIRTHRIPAIGVSHPKISNFGMSLKFTKF
jgi:hypothetical protein